LQHSTLNQKTPFVALSYHPCITFLAVCRRPFKAERVPFASCDSDLMDSDGFGDTWLKLAQFSMSFRLKQFLPQPPEAPEPIRLTITHTDGSPSTLITIPEKGVYKPPATLKQNHVNVTMKRLFLLKPLIFLFNPQRNK
jgi:hypothetical protein